MQRLALIVVFLALPVASGAEPISNGANPLPDRRRVEQHIQDGETRALEQMKGAVCGTGPAYAGTVDHPIFVKPLFHPSCTISPAALP
jgi:hypothetical protein